MKKISIKRYAGITIALFGAAALSLLLFFALFRIMGHSDIQTTMNIYAEVTGVKKQESMMALSDKILV